jgi:uncharacterized protein (DUF362 family)
MSISRRQWMRRSATSVSVASVSVAGISTAGLAGLSTVSCTQTKTQPKPLARSSPVTILKAKDYDSVDLLSVVKRGLQMSGLDPKGKTVLLKPNLVEFASNTCINTDPRVMLAVWEAFHSLGAAKVVIAEGPGHRRDTLGVADEAGYFNVISKFEDHFVDLNRDDVTPVKNFFRKFPDQEDETMEEAYFSRTLLGADLIVSVAKMKTHHWAGATLSMKNYFGLIPSAIYGWPKNRLHFNGIPRSIVQLHKTFQPKSFAIVDGIIGMEGDGPIRGTPKPAGVMVFGPDMVAVDATCARLMSLVPENIEYLAGAAYGNLSESRIEQRGEKIVGLKQRFEVVKKFDYIREA